MKRGAWRAMVYNVTKSRTRLKRLSRHAHVRACSWPFILIEPENNREESSSGTWHLSLKYNVCC